jgi:hypothetical protein
LARRRNPAFLVAGGIALIVIVAFFRLPETLVTQIEHNRPATGWAGDWIYRLLAVVAFLQAVYAGATLRIEKVKHLVPDGPTPPSAYEPMIAILARNAAFAVLFTLVYGLAAFFLTGGRASMWLFVAILVAQWAWYYRQLGKLVRWLLLQPVPDPEPPSWARLPKEPETYVPPLARGLAQDSIDPDLGGSE